MLSQKSNYIKSRYLLFLIIAIGGTQRLLAQGVQPPLTQVIPPSPNMQAMQKYGDIPISAYTGIPNISIPLYTIKYHDVTVPISLSYHASGIKVSEEASNVGLGWVLNAGGSVSRNIIGNDDFLNVAYPYATYFGTTFQNGLDFADGLYPYQGNTYLNGTVSFINSATTAVTPYDISQNLAGAGSSGPAIEFQPDQFYYNLQGQSGKFLLRRNGQAILQTPSNIKIQNSSNGTVWDITTPDGFIYHFDQKETSRSTNEPLSSQHVSAVYLTKITSPEGNVVTFSYNVDLANYIQSIGSWTQSQNDISYFANNPPPGIWPASVPSTASGGSGGQIYTSVCLSYIDYPTGRVLFNFSNDRTDTQSDKKLNSVTVYTKDSQGNLSTQPLKTINLSYSYFSGMDYSNPGAAYANSVFAQQRLRLDSVTVFGLNNQQIHYEKPYRFSYYSPNEGPNKTSLSKDSWGYFNGSGKNTLLPTFIHTSSSDYVGYPDATRYPNATFMTDFTLSDIQYPTGGTTHFDYEANDCDEQKSETHDNAGYLNKYSVIPSPNSPYTDTWYYGQTTNMHDADLTDLYSAFSSLNTATATFIFNTDPGTIYTNKLYISLLDRNNNQIATFDAGYISATKTVQQSVTIISLTQPLPGPGIYHMVTHCDPSFAGNFQHVSFTGSWYTQVNSNADSTVTHPTMYSMAGGLRIKRITDQDGINPPVVKRYIYHGNVGQRTEFSYGIRMSRPEYSYYEQGEDTYTVNLDGVNANVSGVSTEHVMRMSDSNIPLNGSAQGNVVGYSQVTENYGENAENGKTVYQYYNQPDNVPPFLFNNLPRKRPYNSDIADPLNGSLLEQTDYKNASGQFIAVKDVTNTYYVDLTQQNSVFAVEDHPQLHDTFLNGSVTGQDYTPKSPQDRLLLTYTPMQAAFNYQTIKVETDNNSDNAANSVVTQTNYYYDNVHDYLPTRTVATNSKAEIVTSFTKYPKDFANLTNNDPIAPGVNNLISANMFNVPVEKYTQKTASDGSNLRVIAGSITAYYGTGLPLPQSVYELETAIPLTSFSSYAASGALNTNYKPELTFDKYDQTNGNLLQQHKQYDANNAYLWGYHNEYPIAQVVNASLNDIFFENFEQGSGNSTAGDAKTGHYSYSGAYSKALSGLDAGTYTLSYWSKTGSVWALTVNTNVTVSGSTYTISLSGQIDDVRFYPSAAMMSTYTYDPEIGVTSVSDPKCEITFYEYDGLGRLQNIKDKDGNIVKSFCYNYAGQAYGCTIVQTVYTNNQQSGTYTKLAGCGTGYTGSQVTYTVLAGKYTSNISQADADQQAANDVTANGQNYANANGTCIQNITFTITNHDVPYTLVFSVNGNNLPAYNIGTGTNLQISVPAYTGYSLNVYPTSGGSTPYYITLGNRGTVHTVSTIFTGVDISSGSSDLTLIIN